MTIETSLSLGIQPRDISIGSVCIAMNHKQPEAKVLNSLCGAMFAIRSHKRKFNMDSTMCLEN